MDDSKTTAGDLIRNAPVGAFLTLAKVAPQGALQARKLKSGAVMLYWRFTHESKTDRVLVGPYSSALPPKSIEPKDGAYSIRAAQRAAEGLAARHLQNLAAGGHRAVVEAEKAQHAAAKAAKAEAVKGTLHALLDAYVQQLEKLGRQAFRDARSIFQLHVYKPCPAHTEAPASELTEEAVADMLRRLHDLGKARTANKLRAYMRAAFSMARSAHSNPKTPQVFKAFNIRVNPVAETAANSEMNRSAKKPLAAADMRRYWRAIAQRPGFEAAVLRLHMLTGAQRIAQFVRLTLADVTDDAITLHDAKGRPGSAARAHPVPLTGAARDALAAVRTVRYTRADPTAKTHSRKPPKADERPAVYAISTSGGRDHLSPSTLSEWACEIAKEAEIADFEAKRLRSGVETLLAAAGIDRDTRGRLQSHGISGVQAKHYDGHDYMPEKLRALEALEAALLAP